MRRREFITLVGGATVVWPIPAHAQQSAKPVVGFLSSQSRDAASDLVRAFRQGMKEDGFIQGENVTVEYHWADGHVDRLPILAAELLRRGVAVLVTGGAPASIAAKKITTATPIVFTVPEDPVRLGLVASLARPGGNMTGINFFQAELAAKRFALLRDLVPTATSVAVLLDPAEGTIAAANLRAVKNAAHSLRIQLLVRNATNAREITAAFATFAEERPDALFVSSGPFFTSRRVQIAHLATRYAIPTIHASRQYPEVGGLISYGASLPGAYHQVGIYVGHILRGAKPAELPVVQASKFELIINAETARLLGLTLSPSLLAIADQVIE
jgi:putative ABC transport system substrate-binding protein